jgi:hypothetical protein
MNRLREDIPLFRDPIKTLTAIEKNLDKRVAAVLNDVAFQIKRRVDSQEFIHWKTKRKPIVVEKARLVGDLMTVTVRGARGWKWGHVLIGPLGSTTITAKGGMLAIPTDFARKSFRGRTLGPKQYGGLQIFNNIMWGKAGWGGGKTGGGLRQRRAAGERFKKQDLIPLFILKKSVVVRRRVNPAEMQRWGGQLLRAALIKARLLKP